MRSDLSAAEVHELRQDVSKFQTRILEILAEEDRYGLAVKRELEDYYGEKVNHGRLYPNLDGLIDYGLVEKSQLDRRTNNYELTDAGRAFVENDLEWQNSHANEDNGGGE
ncbi:PadR family transcriptional regulator [Natrinema salsiterrestre]|uniref:PadR family transcriptional regulator n=1 Tax=Natrinema salsiterrestre TaxID=2950540 RepID=A0A9Q4L1M0_9EURY|nr:PadR family transcriptional regulator [Natrinema salsiterrestre]MDF9748405.1 PadR family transcriptional regulator [Natrinema salsiterrestre]